MQTKYTSSILRANAQASNWASKKSREFKAYVRSSGEFGHLGFESKGVKEIQVRFLYSKSLNL